MEASPVSFQRVPLPLRVRVAEELAGVAPMALRQGVPAPLPPQHNGVAYWFKVSAQADGTFTVTNSRNGLTKTYRALSRAN